MNVGALSIGPAKPEERATIFRLLFPDDAGVARRFDQAGPMIQNGILDPDSVRVVRDERGIAAAMIAAPLPGNAALVWPPQARPGLADAATTINALCADAVDWLRGRGVRLAQALLPIAESQRQTPLLRNGFQHTTRLLYLRHFLDLTLDQLATADDCDYHTFSDAGEAAFVDVLERTYADSLDCPEITGVRSGRELLDGHRAVGPFDPERWWIAAQDGEPLGLVLATMPEPGTWDVAYLGVVPEARRRGIGAELVRKVLFEAKTAGSQLVTLAVDERNRPARALYQSAGFTSYDTLEVYLRVFA